MKLSGLPEGWVYQGFRFALDARPSDVVLFARHAGMRRVAYNWCVDIFDRHRRDYGCWIEAFCAGSTTEPPPQCDLSAFGLRRQWNAEKSRLCVDENGTQWWRELSKEAAASAIADASDAYWRWAKADTGGGRRAGRPRRKRKGRCRDSYRITTGSYGPSGNRHVKIPRVGRVRVHENMSALTRLLDAGDAKLGSMTVYREGKRWFVAFAVALKPPQRWQQTGRAEHNPASLSTVGVDVGVNCLAVVAGDDGTILERVDNPEPLAAALKQLKALNRAQQRSRDNNHTRTRRHTQRRTQISELHARIKRLREQAWHDLTTRLAKTHDRIVIEDIHAQAMAQQKGPGARTRRRRLADAAVSTLRRHLTYKCERHGCELIVADRWFPSTQICHLCSHRQDVGWARRWVCASCDAHHDRDNNAAVNLAKYPARESHSWRDQRPRSKPAAGEPKRLSGTKTCRPEQETVTAAGNRNDAQRHQPLIRAGSTREGARNKTLDF